MSGAPAQVSNVMGRSRTAMRFATDQVVTAEALDRSSNGTWRIVDDRLCLSIAPDPSRCYAIYKDAAGYVLVSQEQAPDERASVLRTSAFEPGSKSAARGPDTSHPLAIAGVRFGMGMAEAQRIAMEQAGSGASPVAPIRKRDRQADEVFDTGFIVRAAGGGVAARDDIVVLAYPFRSAPTVDAIVRQLRIPSPTNIQDEIVKQLVAQIGPPSGEYRGRDPGSIDLF